MTTDAFALPCHPELRIDEGDRDWGSIGLKGDDSVKRKATRCPTCKANYTAYLRTFELPDSTVGTVEWIRSTPFRVTAVPVSADHPLAPLWQDALEGSGSSQPLPVGEARTAQLAQLQEKVSALGKAWARSAQLCTPVQPMLSGNEVFAVPGDLLLERRERWNNNDRRLALLWSPRLERQVVAWHSFARLPQDWEATP